MWLKQAWGGARCAMQLGTRRFTQQLKRVPSARCPLRGSAQTSSYATSCSPTPNSAVVWGGRAVGCVIVAAGASSLLAFQATHAQENLKASSLDVAEPLLKAILEATSHCIPKKVNEIEKEKTAAAFEALRQKKGVKKDADVKLSQEDIKFFMNTMGEPKSDAMVAAIFEALDPQKSGFVSLKLCEAAVSAFTSHGKSASPEFRRFVFDLFDVNKDGEPGIDQTELQGTLMRLINIALVHTDGKFSEFVSLRTPGKPDVKAEDMCTAIATIMLRDIYGIRIKDNKPISRADFESWLECDLNSSKTVLRLVETMGCVVAGAPGWDMSRYGGYTILFARFVKVAAAKVRYLAFTSDVGEAFRPVVPVWMVNASYALAFAYCIGDVAYVGYKESKKEDGNVPRAVAFQTTFQGLASIALPFLIIHTAVHQSHKFCVKRYGSAHRLAVVVPSVIGLAIIPFLPVVCDEPVEHLLEHAFDAAWPHKGAAHVKEH